MKIYTKTGDKGQTSLFDGTRVYKNNPRVETYGTIDELNSIIGVVVSTIQKSPIRQAQGKKLKTQKYKLEAKNQLETIQKDLLDIGSRLANPSETLEESFAVYLEERIISFEKSIDTMTAKLPELANFILPGGSTAGAFLHVARTITRRVERFLVSLMQKEQVDNVLVKYFNRLSDLFFTMSRFVNNKEKAKEVIWTKYIG